MHPTPPAEADGPPRKRNAEPGSEKRGHDELASWASSGIVPRAWIEASLVPSVISAFGHEAGVGASTDWYCPAVPAPFGALLMISPRFVGKRIPRELARRCRDWLEREWKAEPGDEFRPASDDSGWIRYGICIRPEGAPRPWLTVVLQAMLGNLADGDDSASLENSTPGPGTTNIPGAPMHPGGPPSVPVVERDGFLDAAAVLRRRMEDLAATLRDQGIPCRSNPGPSAVLSDREGPCLDPQPAPPLLPVPPVASSRRARPIVEQMLAFMRQNHQGRLTLDDVADALKMNSAYLSHLFSRTTGVTFHRRLEEIRMERAKELLLDPKFRVREVAGAVGYSSADAFRHAFKAYTGVAPSDWRAVPGDRSRF